jgi:hypothetical protein
MPYIITDPLIGGQLIAATDTVQNHPLGTIVRARETNTGGGGGEFIYLLGVASTVVGSLVTYNATTFQTTLSPTNATTDGAPLAVAMSANVASQYGWYQISGMAVIKKTAVAVSPSSGLWLSGTAGRVYATASTGKGIVGARSANLTTVASATSTVTVLINRPAIETAT